MEIDILLAQLPDECGIYLNAEQKEYLRLEIAHYALGCMMDSHMAKENEIICFEAAVKNKD